MCSSICSDIYHTLGFHTQDTISQEGIDDTKKKVWSVNILNVLGYFPGIGLISGIARIIFSGYQLVKKDLPKIEGGCAIGRGVTESLGLGTIHLILDIFVSIHRHWCQEETSPTPT